MAYQYTLANARTWPELAEVTNVCASTADFAGLLNTAIRRAIKRGNWFGTEHLVRFCVYDCCLALPVYADTLLGVRPCGYAPMQIKNHWYEIMGPSSCWSGMGTVIETGTSPTFTQIANASGSKIRYHVIKQNDLGKTISLFGSFYGALPLQEKDANNVWQPGLTITSAAPFAQTSQLVRHITSVTRQATESMSYLYEVYDEAAGTLRMLAAYGPNETNPRYRTYKLQGIPCACSCEDANGRRITSVEALVKLAFVPVVAENDFLLIDDPDALAYMIQAIKHGRSNDIAKDRAFMMASVDELNMGDRNKLPKEQTPVNVITGARGVRNVF